VLYRGRSRLTRVRPRPSPPSPDTPTRSGPTLSSANYGCDSAANCHHKFFLECCVSWLDRSAARKMMFTIGAKVKAKSLFDTLNMPQNPDGLRILDQYGHEAFFWTPRTDSY
jgi:hypothetical protein